MHTLTLNDNERTLLIEILKADVGALPHEIHKTDSREYRAGLEERLSTLQQLLKKFEAA